MVITIISNDFVMRNHFLTFPACSTHTEEVACEDVSCVWTAGADECKGEVWLFQRDVYLILCRNMFSFY